MSGNDGWFAHDVEQSHNQVDATPTSYKSCYEYFKITGIIC